MLKPVPCSDFLLLHHLFNQQNPLSILHLGSVVSTHVKSSQAFDNLLARQTGWSNDQTAWIKERSTGTHFVNVSKLRKQLQHRLAINWDKLERRPLLPTTNLRSEKIKN